MIQNGYLNEAEKLLGRKYSVFATAEPGVSAGSIKLDVSELCLPPCGRYAVQTRLENTIFEGIANLSLDESKNPLLETRLLQPPEYPFYGKEVEIIFF